VSRLELAAVLLLVLLAFGVAGGIDMAEEERLSLKGYVSANMEKE
jgi:hypothetical protein